LANMNFKWYEAAGVFILWSSQILFQISASQVMIPVIGAEGFNPLIWDHLHVQVLAKYTIVYWIWIVIQISVYFIIYKRLPVVGEFKKAWAVARRRPAV
jgi:hypothetical protein